MHIIEDLPCIFCLVYYTLLRNQMKPGNMKTSSQFNLVSSDDNIVLATRKIITFEQNFLLQRSQILKLFCEYIYIKY